MKRLITLFVYLFTLGCPSLIAVHSPLFDSLEDETKFIEQHRLPSKVKKVMDAHAEELAQMCADCKKVSRCSYFKGGVRVFDWLSGYIVKYDIRRIVGANKIRQCIKENKLDLLRVPQKYLYHLNEKSKEINSQNYLVVVPLIEAKPHPITARHIKQMCVLINKTGYCDIDIWNVWETENNTLTIIDTELSSFRESHESGFARLIPWAGNSCKETVTEIFSQLRNYTQQDKSRYQAIHKKCLEHIEKFDQPLQGSYKKLLEDCFHYIDS